MTELRFNVGDYVDTRVSGYGYIVDILKSETSDRTAVCIEFAYNFPNPRSFDTMIFSPDKTNGMEQWIVVDKRMFDDELIKKVDNLIGKVTGRINETK